MCHTWACSNEVTIKEQTTRIIYIYIYDHRTADLICTDHLSHIG